jgi:hypothetical protein
MTTGASAPQKTAITTDDPEFDAVRRHITLAARQYFPELLRDFDIQCSFPYHSTYPIALFELHDGERRKAIVAKWAPVFDDNNEGLTEFTNYMQFNSTYARPELHFRCPRPLDFLHENNVLLTEEEPGSTLRYVLCHPLRAHEMPGSSQGDTMCALGEWLRAFHELNSTCISGPCAAMYVHQATSHLSGDFAGRPEVLALLGSRSLETLQRARQRIDPASLASCVRVGGVHNDFGPGNIVVNRERVTVLDIGWKLPGLQLSDVAYFTAVISLMVALHLRSQAWGRLAVEQFTHAYFGDSRITPELKLLLGLLRLDAVLRELERHLRRIAEVPAMLQPTVRLLCRRAYEQEIRAAAASSRT